MYATLKTKMEKTRWRFTRGFTRPLMNIPAARGAAVRERLRIQRKGAKRDHVADVVSAMREHVGGPMKTAAYPTYVPCKHHRLMSASENGRDAPLIE